MRHYDAALMYTVLGLAAGLFYREYTKAHEFTGATGLGHMLVTAGLALLFVALYGGVRERQAHLETGRTGGAVIEGA